MTVFVNEHEYFKMVRAREDRIRTFMQLELEACLEEVRWSITCYNCEVLGCPQEEYPARLLPTLPPNYEDNLRNRLRRACPVQEPTGVSLDSGYSTDLSVPASAEEQKNYRTGEAVRRVQPAEEPIESAARRTPV